MRQKLKLHKEQVLLVAIYFRVQVAVLHLQN